jgi:hypothetical protein
MASADKIFWKCPCSEEDTEHAVEYGDGVITCLECFDSKPITEEIDSQIIAQVLDAQI